jgi:hypothetical protein
MASNFAFAPMGLTSPITVGATPATSTFWLVNTGGGTGTLTLVNGAYPPSGLRIANVSTVVVFLSFAPASQPNTAAIATGLPFFPNTVETFCTRGQNSLGYISAGTATLYVTPGEGL